jgi:hypothetical protein
VSTNASNGSTPTNGANWTSGKAWGLWAVGAAIPLSFAGLVVYWLRRRANASTAPDPYEEWWSARSRVRENGTRPETPRSRPEGSSPLFV